MYKAWKNMILLNEVTVKGFYYFFIFMCILIVLFDYSLYSLILNNYFSRFPFMNKATYLISCYWSLSLYSLKAPVNPRYKKGDVKRDYWHEMGEMK